MNIEGQCSSPSQSRGHPHHEAPILLVVCDVEEQFDWSEPFDRANTSVSAMSQIHRLQDMADEYELRPTYVVDYPVASQPEGFEPLKEILRSGRCEVGAHLHPWVTPPFDEEVTTFNSFAGNLTPDLESSKLSALTAILGENLGLRPKVYKAGRYGIGANTDQILLDQGFEVDLSPMPPFDFSDEGGPDFSQWPIKPGFAGSDESLLRIPGTGAYSGFARGAGRWAYPKASTGLMASLHVPGILSRLRLIDRLVLSPEGYSLDEMKRLTWELLRDGVSTFCFSFHSPSLQPGWTPYVRDHQDLKLFESTCQAYFDFFRTEVGGVGMTASEARTHLMSNDSLERQA